MALIGNYLRINKSCGRFFSGATESQTRSNFNSSGSSRGLFVGWANVPRYAGIPNGYEPPGSWIIPYEGGSLASCNNVTGSGSLTISSLSQGKNCSATLTGIGAISNASLSMLIQMAATLLGSCSVTANLKAVTNMTATLAGTSSITASLGVIAFCVSTINGSGSVSGTFTGIANMEADITPFTELSPQNLASAVWEALAADFNNSGTMGEKMNSAASAGDPWSTALPGAYGAGTAGELLGSKVLTEDDLNKIADIILRRATSSVEASSDGETLSMRSLYGMIAQGVHKTPISGSTLTVTKSDETTTLGTRTIVTDATSQPIVSFDTD